MHTVVASRADSRKVCSHLRRDPQRPGTGMADESARYLKEPPAHGGDTMILPALPQSGMFEEHEEIVGDDSDPEECGVSALLTARHTLHAKADFEFLDAILGMFPALAVPDQHIGGTCNGLQSKTACSQSTGFFDSH